jgi:orotidine-5'-phosphate decarboxylase
MVVAVTVLTSLDDEGLRGVGIQQTAAEQVDRLADLARGAGTDGVVASPLEIDRIRRRCGPRFPIVTPGIRGPGSGGDDQARTLTAAGAIQAGAHYIVVGRPIIGASNPRVAAEAICREIAAAGHP